MTAKTLQRIRIAFASAALLLVAVPSMAAVPASVLVEGALTATGGGPAADGNYSVTFSLYSEAGGNPVWVEGPVAISVKNGLFAYSLGSKTKLDQAALAQLGKGVIGIKVEGDPELGQKPLHSATTALRAAVAEGLDCSGCVKAGALDPDSMKAFAKTADLAKVATTGNFSDLNGGPDLSGYAKKSELAKVASTGQYGDLQGAPTLAKVATTGAYGDLTNLPTLADVAKSGSYADLKNLPVEAKLGAACGTGLVMKGIKADGSYDCTASLDANTIAIDDITKGLMFFGETYVGTKNVLIPDNRANSQEEKDIAIDKIAVPNIGTATKLSVTVELAKDAGNSNSNVTDKRILLVAPDNSVYTLFCGAVAGDFKVDGKILCEKTNTDKDYPFLKVYPNPDPVLVGDLTTWIGKNPAGTWTIKIHDYGFNGNGTDGKIATWSLNIHTYGSKKLNVKASAVIEGKLTVGGGIESAGGGLKLPTSTGNCDAAAVGSLRYDGKAGLQVCQGSVDQSDKVTSYFWSAAIPQPVIWSGGCQSHGSSNGWNTYCLNGKEAHSNADVQGYISVDGGGTVTIKRSGWYRMNWFGIGCSGDWNHVKMVKNGYDYIYHGHNHSFGTWQDEFIDMKWPFREGEWFRLDVYRNGGCGHAFHSWNNGGTYSGAHSRMQIEYAGPL